MAPTNPADPVDALLAALAGWPPGGLALSVSGGLDSMVLLDTVIATRATHGRRVRVLHVDHGLHPDSARWADLVVATAEAFDVPVMTLRVEVDVGSGEGLEAAARRARYEALASWLAPGEILVTAHHANDQAETLLLRLMRGAGLEGLAAIRPLRPFARGWLARPWLTVPRAAILARAKLSALKWIDDPANERIERDRNFIRHEILPRLCERWPHAVEAIGTSARHLGELAEREAATDRAELKRLTHAEAPGALDLHAVATLPASRRDALLRRYCLDRGLAPPDRRALAEIARQIEHARPDAETKVRWADVELHAWRDRLYVARQLPDLPSDFEAAWDGLAPFALPAGVGSVAIEPPREGKFRLTARRGGERIELGAGRPSQSVKHALQDADVPPWLRRRAPLLWHHDELWAVGDWLLAAAFRDWLDAVGAKWRWRRGSLAPQEGHR
jgi:tRNA(Ile)-lysidine synthase